MIDESGTWTRRRLDDWAVSSWMAGFAMASGEARVAEGYVLEIMSGVVDSRPRWQA